MPVTTSIGFRTRPVAANFAISTQISKSLRTGRNYQRQHASLTDAVQGAGSTVSAGAFTGYNYLVLQPGDTLVAA